jgi:PadR family transcriptional regulator, regulatory protein PadR
MTARRTNPDYLNGVPELLILELLARRPCYGYQLVQAIREATGHELAFGEGCIYPILHRLEAEGLLDSRRQSIQGRDRVVYRVTTKGRKRLGESVAHWRRIVETVESVLHGGPRERPAMA